MSSAKVSGLILIGLGIAALAYQGFSYTTSDKVVDFGPIHVTNEETHKLPLPPIVGAIAVAGGIALLVLTGRKR
jgi:hypothetical protein